MSDRAPCNVETFFGLSQSLIKSLRNKVGDFLFTILDCLMKKYFYSLSFDTFFVEEYSKQLSSIQIREVQKIDNG